MVMKMKLFASNVKVEKEIEVHTQDIIDAIGTLSPKGKLSVPVEHPGKGPNFFLNWANEELLEAATSDNNNFKNRKYYNCSVYSKGAVECLVDWFLSKFLLNYTISPMASIAQKLDALDSENLLGISFSLFNDVVFEPRNRGIHKFELIKASEAKHGYELANLTIKNCVNTVSPENAPVFYGDLEYYEGDEALYKIDHIDHKKIKDMDAFCLAGIGASGSCGVLIDREHPDGKISILTVHEGSSIESRYCKIRGKFKPEELRSVFTALEMGNVKEIEMVDKSNFRHVLETLLPNRRERLTKNSSRRKKTRG
jgi:hypothetical protein